MIHFVITSAIAFISTNIDDIFILMLFFGNRRFGPGQIVIGQFLGIAVLIGLSLLLSLVGLVVGKEYMGLLGLIPILLGLKGVFALFRDKQENNDDPLANSSGKSNVTIVAGVTIANGGDNVGIYVPLFASLQWEHRLSMITVFFVMTGLLCAMAQYLTDRPVIAKAIDKYGHRITPFVLILLGIFIIYESGTLTLFGV